MLQPPLTLRFLKIMINPGAKMRGFRKQTRNGPIEKIGNSFTQMQPSFISEKMHCVDLILKKLQKMENSTVEEIFDLYEKARRHTELPHLLINPGETSREILLRAKFCIQSTAVHRQAKRKFNISRLTAASRRKSPGEAYEEWKEKKRKISTAREYTREIQSAYDDCQERIAMHTPSKMLDDIILSPRRPSLSKGTEIDSPPNNPAPNSTQTSYKNLHTLPIQSLSFSRYRSSTLQKTSSKPGKKLDSHSIPLSKLKYKLAKIMNNCSDIEENAVHSQRIIKSHRANINKTLQKTESISSLISKDNMAQRLKNKYGSITNRPELYHILTSRKKKMIENIDKYNDVFARFTEDEAKEYLQKKREGSTYDAALVRFTKEFTHKTALQNNTKKNTRYFNDIDKVLSQLSYD